MQRLIKFRAWDGEKMDRCWKDGRLVIDASTGEAQKIGYGSTPFNVSIPHGLTLMQYTGLKDKNGVEIYEGDIIQYYTFYYGNKRERKEVVEWIDDMQDDSFGEPLSMGYRFYGSEIEVIGNIYENHQLLEATQ